MVIKNLSEVSKAEQADFINSFDRLLVDMDGVIWVAFTPIPDAQICLENFKKLGKPIQLVSNYAASSRATTLERLIKNKFNFELEDIVNPCVAIVDYFKRRNFQKKIYAIASQSFKDELRSAGLELEKDPPQQVEENIAVVLQNIQDDEEIGAVVCDLDVNLTYLKLQKALTYLKRQDCLFIIGGADKVLPIGQMGPLLGNFYNYQGLSEISGRKPMQLAKPSEHYKKYITEKLEIKNPERVLFIGDTITEDMRFAAEGGFKKLLVLSGSTKIEDVKNWKYPEELEPNYYIESLTELNTIIKNNHKL